MDGMLSEVEVLERGSTLTAAASVGALVLTVDDTTAFGESTPDDPDANDVGTVQVPGAELDYVAVDSDAGTLTLAVPLAVALSEGDPVWRMAGGQVARDWRAVVDFGTGDPVRVPLPYAFRALLPEGEYDPPVPVTVAADFSAVLEVDGREPVVDGSMIDPTTIPDQLPTAPPATPTLVAGGTIDSLILSAGNLAGTSQVIFHLSATPGFTPGPSTALGPASRTAVEVARALPAGGALVPDTDYYAVAEAVNAVGSSFSPEVAVRLDQDAASTLFTELLIAAEIVADSIEISGVFRINSDEGLIIEHPDGTKTQINADGSGSHFAGTGSFTELNARHLSITDDSLVDGSLILGNGVKAPPAPRVYSQHPEQLQTDLSASTWLGLFDDGSSWVTAVNAGVGAVASIDKTTGAVTGLALLDFNPSGGVVKVGTRWYALGLFGDEWRVKVYDASWAEVDEIASGTAADTLVCIGVDGSGNLLFAYQISGSIYAQRTTTAGAILNTWSLGTWPGITRLTGVAFGSFDFGADRIVIMADTGVRVFNTSEVRQTAQEWANFAGEANRGFSWDGSRFNQLTSSQRVWTLSPIVTDTSRSIRTTLRDSVDGDETDGSPAVSFTQRARRRFRVEWDLPPDTGGSHWPDMARVYVSDKRQTPEPAVGAKSLTIETPTTGAADIPAVNGFPAATAPGSITSSKADGSGPIIKLGGGGAGRTGPLAWDGDGAPTDVVTSGFYTLESGWSATGVNAIRFGRFVEISMLLTRSTSITVPADGNMGNITAMTLSAGWRPLVRKGAGAHASSRLLAWDIQPSGVVNLAAAAPGSNIAAGETMAFSATYMAAT